MKYLDLKYDKFIFRYDSQDQIILFMINQHTNLEYLIKNFQNLIISNK